MDSSRSSELVWTVLGAIAVGVFCAYVFPVYTFDGERVDFADLDNALIAFSEKGWLVVMAGCGITIAAMAAIAYRGDERQAQALWISGGMALIAPLAIWMWSEREGAGFGAGAWLAIAAFAVAGAAPWWFLRKAEAEEWPRVQAQRAQEPTPSWMLGRPGGSGPSGPPSGPSGTLPG